MAIEKRTQAAPALREEHLKAMAVSADLAGALPDRTQGDGAETPQSEQLVLVVRNACSGDVLADALPALAGDTAAQLGAAALRRAGGPGVVLPRLLFRSRMLGDQETLREAGVVSGDTVFLVLGALRCFTACLDGIARLRHFSSGVEHVVDAGDTLMAATLAPGGSTFVTVSASGDGRLWCAETGKPLRTLPDEMLSCSFSADGRRFVGGSSDLARIWCSQTGDCLQELAGHSDDVRSAVFSPDGAKVATASSDGTARIFDAASGDHLATLSGHHSAVKTASFSADGSLVVTASMDGTARIWDGTSGELRHVLAGHKKQVNTAVFSPDGARVLTTSADGTARVWGASTGECAVTLVGAGGVMKSAAFSPDGSTVLLVSGSEDVILFSTDSGERCLKFGGHADWVREASFCPFGAFVVTASYDGSTKIWNVASGECVQAFTDSATAVVSAQIAGA